jgi:hypothetical protein
MDASHLFAPRVSYWRWFAASNIGTPYLGVWISNDAGATWTPVETVTLNQPQWRRISYTIEDYLPRTSAMRFKFRAVDWPSLDVLEVAIDDFKLSGFQPALDLAVSGAPSVGGTTIISVTAPQFASAGYVLGVARTAHQGIPLSVGTVPLDPDDLFDLVPLFPSIFQSFTGQLDGQGMATAQLAIPNTPVISGWSFVLSGVTVDLTPAATAIAGGQRFVIP